MSRKSRELPIEAQDCWPTLYQFLAGYCHQDWPELYGSIEGAVDAAVSEYPLERRRQVLNEWRDWNNMKGAAFDPRPAVNDGLGVNYQFNEPVEARQFMNGVYEKLIVSVRSEEGKHWKS